MGYEAHDYWGDLDEGTRQVFEAEGLKADHYNHVRAASAAESAARLVVTEMRNAGLTELEEGKKE